MKKVVKAAKKLDRSDLRVKELDAALAGARRSENSTTPTGPHTDISCM